MNCLKKSVRQGLYAIFVCNFLHFCGKVLCFKLLILLVKVAVKGESVMQKLVSVCSGEQCG